MQYKFGQKQLRVIREVFLTAQKGNKFLFIKGGWNIDLQFGEQTRGHEDIDFHYDLKDKKFWKEYFSLKGFTVVEKDPWYMIFNNIQGIQIDFEGVQIAENF